MQILNRYLLCHRCWIDESQYSWVLVVLVASSMLLNLIFLINIIRVVVSKLRAGPSSRPSTATLQALRAVLLLLPLLGLNYLLTPFRPPDKHPWETYYELTSALTSSFQVIARIEIESYKRLIKIYFDVDIT